jgi:hypothetical protein
MVVEVCRILSIADSLLTFIFQYCIDNLHHFLVELVHALMPKVLLGLYQVCLVVCMSSFDA